MKTFSKSVLIFLLVIIGTQTGTLTVFADRVAPDPTLVTMDEDGDIEIVEVTLDEPIIIPEEGDPWVTINISSNDDRVEVSPASITFLDNEWREIKEFTITTVGDLILNPDNDAIITLSVVSDSEYYSGYETSVAVTLVDDEEEDGGLATYRYVKWEITKKKTAEECSGGACIQVSEFMLLNDGDTVPWTEETISTNPGGSNPGSETPDNAIDGDSFSKWLDWNFNAGNPGEVTGNSILIIDTGEGNTVTFNGYQWVTGNDSTNRDPVSWNLYGSDDGETWVLLDARDDETITDDRNSNTDQFIFAGEDDSTPPDTFINSATADSISSSTATFEFSSDDILATFECALDDGIVLEDFVSCVSPYTRSVLAVNDYILYVRAIDASNNIDSTPASESWAISDIDVLSVSPVDGAINVDIDSTVTVTFSESVPTFFRLRTNIATSPCDPFCPTLSGEWTSPTTLVFTNSEDFDQGVAYTMAIYMDNGIASENMHEWSFTTRTRSSGNSGSRINRTDSISKVNQTLGDPGLCPIDKIINQNLRAPSQNGKYNSYTKGIVTEAKILQAHLNRLGFVSGLEDGILGPISMGAIKRMQTFLKTTPDGFVGPITRGLLNNSCGSAGLQQ